MKQHIENFDNLNFDFSPYLFCNESLLDHLSATEDTILRNAEVINVKKGERIFEEGESPKFIYKLLSGFVKKHSNSIFNREHIFYICHKNEFLGYHAVLINGNYLDSATAITDCSLMAIPKDDFLNAITSSEPLSEKLLKYLGHEFGVFINYTKLLAKYTVRERTALHLLILNKKFNQDNYDENSILLNRDDLSSLIGAAKETVVRTLREFKDDHLISTHRSVITLLNIEKLLKVSNIAFKPRH